MKYSSLREFVRKPPRLPAGVVAVLLCETTQCATASATRLQDQGAAAVISLGIAPDLSLDIPHFQIEEQLCEVNLHYQVNKLIDVLAGHWVAWTWNGEFLVYPFCESRSLSDLAGFLADERRNTLYCYALDLYADDLPAANPDATELYFDVEGYHAFPTANQQLTVYGGLGWRFAELVPKDMHQIGRTAVFRAQKGIYLNAAMVFDDLDYASVSCPWHHSPTGAVMSFRRTRRIMAHQNFGPLRSKLQWDGSRAFAWSSRQLLEEGMIEPGQWF